MKGQVGEEGRLDGLLCSCNALSKKTLVGHAQWETIYPALTGKGRGVVVGSMRTVKGSLGHSP